MGGEKWKEVFGKAKVNAIEEQEKELAEKELEKTEINWRSIDAAKQRGDLDEKTVVDMGWKRLEGGQLVCNCVDCASKRDIETIKEFERQVDLELERATIERARKEQMEYDRQAEKEKQHLTHPFYDRVDEITRNVAVTQILKGADKYDEPFNPASWTNKELVMHQLQELRDAQVYGVGLLDRLEEQEAEIEKGRAAIIENVRLRQNFEWLKKENEEFIKEIEVLKGATVKLEKWEKAARIESEFWRLKFMQASGMDEKKVREEIGKGFIIDERV